MRLSTRVLVTGGAGFIGSHVVELLLEKGFSVTVLDDFSTGKVGNIPSDAISLRVIEGSILDKDKVADSMSGCEVVIHLAAIASVQQSVDDPLGTHQVNFDGTLILLEVAKRLRVKRFLYASSAAVYGDTVEDPIKESGQLSPKTPYAIDKLSGETYLEYYAQNFAIQYTSFRFFNIYGPRQDPLSPYSGVISIFMDRAVSGETLYVFGNGLQTRDFFYVKDLARVLIDSIDKEKSYGKSVNVGVGKSVSLVDLLGKISEVLGVRVDVEHRAERLGDIKHSLADVGLLHDIFDLSSTTSLSVGLAELHNESHAAFNEAKKNIN